MTVAPTFPARAAVPQRHHIDIVASPKMDTPSLVAALCTCGSYRGGPATEPHARKCGQQHVADAVVNDAAAILDAGLEWLLNTVQPSTMSICQHLGVYRATPDRSFGFIPSPTWPIVVMQLVDAAHDDHGTLTNPLTKFDVTSLCAAIGRRGHQIRETWNGKGTHTVSVAIGGEVHPTLLDAVGRYRQGCPRHHSVFCRADECRWWQRRTLLVGPTWPEEA